MIEAPNNDTVTGGVADKHGGNGSRDPTKVLNHSVSEPLALSLYSEFPHTYLSPLSLT